MDGILNINKPAGMTSFGAVSRVKRLTGEKHAGHAGTLDPDATGVLPIFLGKATRVVEFLMDDKKTYRAGIELGKATDTYDGSGKVIYQQDPKDIKRKQVEEVLKSFRGEIEQVPPMYSALKHQGQPLYRLARAGVNIERQSRKVNIYRLELLKYKAPLIELEIECSKGTYIRSLANDLGEKLRCGAYLKSLARTQYGIFSIEDAISLEGLEEAVKSGDWQQYLHPTDSVLQSMDSVTVDETGEAAIKTGSLLNNGETHYNGRGMGQKYLRAYGAGGRFLGILVQDKESGAWRPKKVFI
ncbi:MAG: tRNA pseudouridine(55) synthase TruB [Dehalococcoidales bacterium]|nr:tRNA pseudouridine(55) synthase TruB [Dehalococcoidales bacterium]